MRFFKKSLIFLLVNLLAACGLSLLLRQPYTLELFVDQYRAENCNAIIVGQSEAEVGIDPLRLENGEDRIFNFARSGMGLPHIYYLIKEIDRDDSLRKVYLCVDEEYWFDYRNAFDKIGGAKSNPLYLLRESVRHQENPEYIFDMLQQQELFDVLFDYKLNSGYVRNIPRNLERKLSGDYVPPQNDEEFTELIRAYDQNLPGRYQYRGRGFSFGTQSEESEVPDLNSKTFPDIRPQPQKIFDRRMIDPRVVDSFYRILDYCEQNEIQLICFMTPLDPVTLWTEDRGDVHDYFAELFGENGIPFYDLNYLKFSDLPRTGMDYMDDGGHVTGEMAARVAGLLNEIVHSQDPSAYFRGNYQEVLEDLAACCLIRQ